MPFWKKAFSKRTGVYYPQTVVQGKPVETETIAKDLSKISTVSNSDVQAVRVQFIPERTRTSGGAYTRALVDTEQLEWIELPATAEDTTPGGGGGNDGDQEVNPLG